MNQPAKAAKARASMRGKSGEVFCVIARLVPDIFFARMAQIEKLQGAFKKLVDFYFADFLGGQEGSEKEIDQLFERSEEHTSELQSRLHLVCRLLLEKKKN